MIPSQTSTPPRASTELRRAFLRYFEERGHSVVPSSPLVPIGDPTLLFTTAGMVQFKPYYTATGDVPYTRAVSVQKCLRLTDLDNVGLTPRHDTFFEMLGNFSFGPRERGAYFKEEAVAFAWEFVTGLLGLPKERLYASIFAGEGNLPRDDEAAALWKKMGLSADHIVPLGRADNFWGPAGGQGACGPCSEIYFDLGEQRPDYLPEGAFWGERPGDPGDRYMEFWNLVFPQFDAQPDGTLVQLPRPGIDTGMGLERLSMIMQGKLTIFDTDLFAPLVNAVLELSGTNATRSPIATRDARIVADHTRALVFAIAEGALPGNEGVGYVLRRLLRRAVTRGRSRRGLAIHRTFLARVAEQAIEMFGGHYAELRERRDQILKVLDQEEAGFVQTFEAGLARLEELLGTGTREIAGGDAFVLHDTYGFPVELTEEIARERGVSVERESFERAMEEQRTRARAASKFTKGEGAERAPWTEVTKGSDSEFLGYSTLEADGLSLRRWRAAGDDLELVLDRTPFYAESGGQVGDRGRIEAEGVVAEVVDVRKEDDHVVHRVRVQPGPGDVLGATDATGRVEVARSGAFAAERALAGVHPRFQAILEAGAAGRLAARVERTHRLPTERHHTATHLLHAALRHVLGTHVRQAGSLVAPDRLRFDYTHFEHPTPEQLAEIERIVNAWTLGNCEVSWEVMPIARAREMGAMALFGEKYGAEVRMVSVPGGPDVGIEISRELCGGTHVSRTGDIGAFVIVSDGAIASGVRRIEALSGLESLRHLESQSRILQRVAAALQTQPAAVPEQVEKLRGENERLRKAEAEQKKGGLEAEMLKLADAATAAPGGRWVVESFRSDADANAVREAADRLRGRLQRGAALLALEGDGKLMFLAAVTDDLVAEKRLRADELVRAVAKVTGGSGGGKPHLALAGGKDVSKLGEALAEARRLIQEALAS